MPKKDKDEEKKTKGKGRKQDKESPRKSPRLKSKEVKSDKKVKGKKSKNASPIKEEEEKKGKDPAAPKRANSSYICFANVHRKKVMDDNPGKKIGEIGKMLGSMWNGLTDKEKKKYNKMAEEAKVK
jgi:structure-specific recognition protein 1